MKNAIIVATLVLLVFFNTSSNCAVTPRNDSSSVLLKYIEKQIEQRKYKESLLLLDQELCKNPKNIDFLYKKASIYADQEKWKDAIDTLNCVLMIKPNYKEAIDLRKKMIIKKMAVPQNEIGFDQNEAYINDLTAFWSYSSLHYYRLTDYGNFGARINQAHRFGTTSQQYLLEAYPKIFKLGNLVLLYGYSKNSQINYPTSLYRVEGYFNLPCDYEFSIGNQRLKYSNFSNQNIYLYTGSIGKYEGNYYFTFRPLFHTPVGTKYYEINVRRYFKDANHYLSLRLGAGKLPDIGDVPPLDELIIINQKGISLEGQTSLTQCIFIKGELGYLKQNFPSRLRRNVTNGNIGLVWRF